MKINTKIKLKRALSAGMAFAIALMFVAAPIKSNAAKIFTDEDGLKYQIKTEPTEDENGTCIIIGATSKSITELTISGSVNPEEEGNEAEYDVVEIKKGAFKNFKKLKEVEIDSDVEIKKIPDNAFSGCKKLAEVSLKNEDLTTIGKNAFKGCKNLKSIQILSKSLKQGSIKKDAFSGTKSGLKVEGQTTNYSKKYAKFIGNRGGKSVKAVKVEEEEDDDEDDE